MTKDPIYDKVICAYLILVSFSLDPGTLSRVTGICSRVYYESGLLKNVLHIELLY